MHIYPDAHILAVKTDVSSNESVRLLVEKAVEKFGRLDLAVNNAGIGGVLSATADYPEEVFDQLVKVNLKGVFLCMKHEIKQMQQQGKGQYSIVNMSSLAGIRAFTMNAPYASVKHGVIGLTKSAAIEYAKAGIRINSVCPAPIETVLWQGLFVGERAGHDSSFITKIPIGRAGNADEVSSAVLWLLSSASSFTTGSELTVDGGYSAE
eukprot:Phypoly_transcript_15422.p1 GENE.Phypoly_transcript_15422~~Phypoly_transcript_15422.p1  ORF type:complete len:208 (+),score=23.16 Phypoly_transcript_15422:292-915(+)